MAVIYTLTSNMLNVKSINMNRKIVELALSLKCCNTNDMYTHYLLNKAYEFIINLGIIVFFNSNNHIESNISKKFIDLFILVKSNEPLKFL